MLKKINLIGNIAGLKWENMMHQHRLTTLENSQISKKLPILDILKAQHRCFLVFKMILNIGKIA